MLHGKKNTLTHIVNYEKIIFDKKIIWKVRNDVCQPRINPQIF